jgi:hypothetical protein
MAFNLNGFNFNQSIVDSNGRVINKWADIINRANLAAGDIIYRRYTWVRLRSFWSFLGAWIERSHKQ